MAAQARAISETIAGMKRVIANYQDSSDSDEPYLQSSNRGNKLKRKTRHLEDGPSSRMKGPKVYKRTIEHSGYQRNILRRNPRRYDEDGDDLADSESDEAADARVAEENPYAEIHLENLLSPLVSAAGLPDHPSASVAYSSPILTNMAQHACEMVQRERKTLANAKRMMITLRGDETWIPCGLMCSDRDNAIFDTDKLYKRVVTCRPPHKSDRFTTQNLFSSEAKSESQSDSRRSSTIGAELLSSRDVVEQLPKETVAESDIDENKVVINGQAFVEDAKDEGSIKPTTNELHEKRDVVMTEDPRSDSIPEKSGTGEKGIGNEAMDTVGHEDSETGPSHVESEGSNRVVRPSSAQSGEGIDNEPETVLANEDAPMNHLPTPDADEPEIEMSEAGTEAQDGARAAPRRMRTRAQAQAASEHPASSRNESPDTWLPPEIHPLFMIPPVAVPDQNFGLPTNEADDTRRLLTMYVQKQEEICRGAEKLYDGLLQADRQRREVLQWCKAERHVGEMSDGEDWYDKEEWGLDANLAKGQDDEDGDANPIQGKKTRGRRV